MSFAARARSARAANDTTRAQINNIPEKSHVIPLLLRGHAMTSIVSIFARSDGAVNEKGEGTLRDAYINGHSSH